MKTLLKENGSNQLTITSVRANQLVQSSFPDAGKVVACHLDLPQGTSALTLQVKLQKKHSPIIYTFIKKTKKHMKTPFKKISSAVLLLLLFFGLTSYGQTGISASVLPSCAANSGSVTFTVNNGTPPYTFHVQQDFPPFAQYNQTSPSLSGLAPGMYEVYVSGTNDSASTVFQISSIVNISATITNTVCPGNSGSVALTATGGSTPYHYSWSTGATTATINNLPGGIYTVDVTDANGCFATQMDSILATTNLRASISVTGSACNPILTASSTGGASPFNYTWNTGATTAAITSLSSNSYYYVTSTDANGCTAAINQFVTLTGLVIDSAAVAITYANCHNTNGGIVVTMNNGTAPFHYLWSNGATANAISGLTAGNYSLTVTDAQGCSASAAYNLTYNSHVQSYFSTDLNPNCGLSNGALSIYGYESNPTTFTYNWSNGATNAVLTGLPAGTYTVTITDASGCTAEQSIALTGVAAFRVSATTTPTACDSSLHTGTATAIITGTGTAPYSFVWSEWDYQQQQFVQIGTGQTVTGLGLYAYVHLLVTDASGCAAPVYDSINISTDPACYDHITGYVFNDANGNCLYDNGEAGVTYGSVIATGTNGRIFYANPDPSGYYDLTVLPGNYTVTLSLYSGSNCSMNNCTNSYNASFNAISLLSSGNNFATGSGTPTFDLGVHMGYQGSAPGQQREYWVYYYNWGQTAVANGTLTFVHDPNITLSSTIPPYTSYDAATYTITWDITNNLSPMTWLDAQHQVKMFFDIPSSVTLGTLLTAQAIINPVANDCDPSNNTQILNDYVTASHDPNHKEVSPAGNLSAADTVLTYTIRFQNTGNAAATLVVITDTLAPGVDPATVQPGASSSPYTWKITGNGVLTFTFEPINLVDSSQSVAGSEGFVMYTIKTKPNLPIGATIQNTAYIYFDANPAIVTNTTSNLRSDHPTGIKEIVNSEMTAQIMPNPVHDQARIQFTGSTGTITLKLADELGNIIATGNFDNQNYTLNAEQLASGIYFYTAKDAAGHIANGKISVVR